MTERYVRVVITTDVRVLDPTWDDTTLMENLVHYVESAIGAAEARSRRRFPDDNDQAYQLCDEDVTVFLADDFVQDLAEIATLPESERAEMSTIANMPPPDRRNFWWSTIAEGTPA
jgi:hypothetical protein